MGSGLSPVGKQTLWLSFMGIAHRVSVVAGSSIVVAQSGERFGPVRSCFSKQGRFADLTITDLGYALFDGSRRARV